VTTTALQSIRHVLPADTEREAHDYAIDGVLPLAAFSPDDRHETAALLREASEAGLALAPQGSRTMLALGLPLERYDLALDISGLHRVVEYVPDDLTITVEAGMTLRRLQEELAEHGQYLPVDPPPDDRVTVGGLLASGRPGAWRGHLPAPRDLLLGLTAAQTDGSLARSGGRVVKNVSGYDLHRLHTGALGAFGVIVEASFKVSPLPPAAHTLAVRCRDLPSAGRVAIALRDANLATRALSVIAPRAAAHARLPNEPHVLVEFAGSETAVARSLRDARSLAAAPIAIDEPGEAP
jgi:glycolate oxidase FAD binding subunit